MHPCVIQDVSSCQINKYLQLELITTDTSLLMESISARVWNKVLCCLCWQVPDSHIVLHKNMIVDEFKNQVLFYVSECWNWQRGYSRPCESMYTVSLLYKQQTLNLYRSSWYLFVFIVLVYCTHGYEKSHHLHFLLWVVIIFIWQLF